MIDKFRTLATKLADKMLVPATLEIEQGGNDRLTGRRSTNRFPVSCKAVIAPRKTMSANGILIVQSVATVTVKPNIGDKLLIGSSTYTFETVEEIAPDGEPIIWRGVVK
ncbi:hypothetical protein [Brevundimonas sp.]|uniref:hypothetical protein n=1 Tax=Brevundimonas sp. TaxID=1871086 RepID=UPI0035ADD57C